MEGGRSFNLDGMREKGLVHLNDIGTFEEICCRPLLLILKTAGSSTDERTVLLHFILMSALP